MLDMAVLTSWDVRCGLAELAKDFVESARQHANVEIIPFTACGCWNHYKDFDTIFMFYHPLYVPTNKLLYWTQKVATGAPDAEIFVHVTDSTRDLFFWDRLEQFLRGVIVYYEEMVTRVTYIPNKTFIVPHGVREIEERSKEEARKLVGIDGYPVVATFGFPSYYKRYDKIILAMKRVQVQYPDALLVMCCSPWMKKRVTDRCEVFLRDLIRVAGVNALFLNDKWKLKDYMPYLQASNIYVAHQAMKDNYTQSGSCFQGFTARRPTIINSRRIFTQARPYSLMIKPESTPELIAESIMYLCRDENAYAVLERKAREAYEKFRWTAVSKQYLDLFEHATNGDDLTKFAYDPNVVVEQARWVPQ